MSFTKYDQGKPRPDLLPAGFLLEMGAVMSHGAAKYGADNWRLCTDKARYLGAAFRHLLKYLTGQKLDQESGYSHLAHCACSLAMAWGLENEGS